VTRAFEVDQLDVRVFDDVHALAVSATEDAAHAVRDAIDGDGLARVVFASGNSQLEFLDALVRRHDVDWSRVVGFHMDEYVGIDPDHPASFRRYMRERIEARVTMAAFHYLRGDAIDPDAEAARYAELLRDGPIALCCLGIGENGHLAFNDPPVADFADPLDVKVVALEDTSRRQQVGEGHFASLADVPTHAITVTVPALLRAARVLAIVPEARKAEPVRAALTGPVGTACPASALRTHPHATLYLDADSAALVSR
jgi:glucosamine-6-phosphate deaminase